MATPDFVCHDGFDCEEDCDACAFAKENADLRKDLRTLAEQWVMVSKSRLPHHPDCPCEFCELVQRVLAPRGN